MLLRTSKLPTVSMIVRNEDQWIWYAISSVINFSSQILIYDTGSCDKTIDIIKTFPQNKIVFEKKELVDPQQITTLRQEHLIRTKSDWFVIVDGDEVWPKKSIEELINTMDTAQKDKSAIVVRSRICVGDIYHCQPESAGKYNIGGRKGHINIRAYRKLTNYHWAGKYPDEAYVGPQGIPVQDEQDKLIFVNSYYWHLRHLSRSSRFFNKKRKLEIGMPIDRILLPEVFWKRRPTIVPSPWIKLTDKENFIATLVNPLRKIKRQIL